MSEIDNDMIDIVEIIEKKSNQLITQYKSLCETNKALQQEYSNLNSQYHSALNILNDLKDDYEALKAEKDQNAVQQLEVNDTKADKLEYQKQIDEMTYKYEELEKKYFSTYNLLQNEMKKVDAMQMELELAQRGRDIALRKQSITPEQKKMFVKLEHENYKINEAIERIDFVCSSLKKILEEDKDRQYQDA